MNKIIFFLYSELSEYTVECLNYLSDSNNFEIYVFSWPINIEAPFEFNISKKINHLNVNLIFEKSKELKPDMIFCSGWLDKTYIKLIKSIKFKSTKILMVDNYWKNSPRQILAKFFYEKFISKYFDLCWVPSKYHVSYAKKIGFDFKNIYLGLYSRNLKSFQKSFEKYQKSKLDDFPKKFIYVGRYLKLKGVKDLWDAFEKFCEFNNEWELHCVGTGELSKSFKIHPKIYHHGFLSKSQILNLSKDTGVFIMPSHSDHWCMAVQEFACLGFPLICSKKVASSFTFLREGENGFLFNEKNIEDLVASMQKISEMNNEELNRFAIKSNELSFLYNLDTWRDTIFKISNL